MKRVPLAPRQAAVFEFLRSHIANKGFPPTFREIGKALGIANINGVAVHVKALTAKGYVSRIPNRARAITLLR